MPTAEGTLYPAASPPLMPFFFPLRNLVHLYATITQSLVKQGFFNEHRGKKKGVEKCSF